MRRCRSCEAPAGDEQRFCGACGARLRVPHPVTGDLEAAAGGELRLVTVLFCDLVGHTERSDGVDADIVRELLSGYFEVARDVVERHGGVVEKFIGDAVMAVWGVPIASENDAERAVLAGLELVRAVADYGARGPAARAVAGVLRARIGVVTGRAATMHSADEGIVVGDRVNTAARIQSIAEPGTVLVDSVTRDLTSAAVAFADGGLHALKGKAEPVQVWRAERVLTRSAVWRQDGLVTDLIGRDAELVLLEELYHSCSEAGTARLVSIVGQAGVGKSRLARELTRYLDELPSAVLWHSGRCLSHGDGVAFWALAQMVRQRLHIGEQESTEVTRQRLTEGLARWVASAADRALIEPRLGQLLGVAAPAVGGPDLFAAWRLFFEHLSHQGPVVCLVDDLHLADDALLDFLESLLDWSSRHRILIVTLARPELLQRRPSWGRRPNATSIGLEPLEDAAMTRLLRGLVDLPDDVVRRVVEHSEGIPLFAVEIARSLIDRGLSSDAGGGRILLGDHAELEVPATLTALLTARVDRLPPEERTLVYDLAVLGTTFPREAIDAVAQRSATPLHELIASLIRKEVLSVVADPLTTERGYLQFAQGMMRTVVYDTLTRRERKARHIAVAQHLQRTFADGGAEVAEVVAEHYRQAFDADHEASDAAELRRAAAAAFTRAGDRVANLGAASAAANAYGSALTLVDDAAECARLLHKAGTMSGRAGRMEEAATQLAAAQSELERHGLTSEAREAVADLARVLADAGRTREANECLDAAIAALPSGAADVGTARLFLQAGGFRVVEGRIDDATSALLEQALHLAEGLGDRRLLARTLNIDGMRHHVLGNAAMARIMLHAAVDVARPLDDPQLLGLVLGNYAQVLTGDDEPAEAVLEESLAITRMLGRATGIGLTAGNLVRSLLLRGQWDRASEVARRAHEDLAARTALGTSDPVRWLAALTAWRGDHDEARRLYESSHVAAEEPQDRALHECIGLILRHAAGDLDGLAAQALALLERDASTLGWRSDSPPQLWPIGIDAAFRTGDGGVAERLLAMLARLQPGHRSRYLSAELMRARARFALAHGERDIDVERILGQVIERFASLDRPLSEAAARLDLRDWLLAVGREEDAATVADPAVTTARRLRAAALLARIDPPSSEAGERAHHQPASVPGGEPSSVAGEDAVTRSR